MTDIYWRKGKFNMDAINEGNNRENEGTNRKNDYYQQQCVKLQLYSIYGVMGNSIASGKRCEELKRMFKSFIESNEQNRMDNDKERNYY